MWPSGITVDGMVLDNLHLGRNPDHEVQGGIIQFASCAAGRVVHHAGETCWQLKIGKLHVLLRRLFPDLDGLHDAMLREVDTYISGPNFATKHGAPDYRVDRTTLQLTGPCRVSYEHGAGEWQTDYHFLTWFHHCDAY